jgi:hypothetical protein
LAGRDSDLSGRTIAELGELISAALDQLAGREDPAAFTELLRLQQELGLQLGESARNLAARGSWAGVATLSGTTKQAAWSRWSG